MDGAGSLATPPKLSQAWHLFFSPESTSCACPHGAKKRVGSLPEHRRGAPLATVSPSARWLPLGAPPPPPATARARAPLPDMTAAPLAEPLLADGAAPAPSGCVLWQWVFYINVFMACISFSIVMPSLFLYLQEMGASASFYALVVASYSVGEAVGSLSLGAVSNRLGARRTLQLTALTSLVGSVSSCAAASQGSCKDATA